jgi:CubicO group peptidase (beta-lactamase class C family)
MEDTLTSATGYDFGAAHAAMARYVDADILAGVSSAVLVGRDLVDLSCVGWADKEQGMAMRSDHLFRVFSNTKLVTSCAALLLFEEGRFQLDDPIEKFMPQLANRRVLKPGAAALDDTEPARGPITIRHLLSHSSGLSYGICDPGTTIFKAYDERKVLSPDTSLAQMVDTLADLPLVSHPGSGWEYSVSLDVIARLVEIVSGERFDAFLQSRIFNPLAMVDTGYVVPEEKRHRLATYYVGADPADPMKPGLTRADDSRYPQAYLRPFPRLPGGGAWGGRGLLRGGLVTSLPDMLTLLRSLLPGGPTLLKPETIALMMTNQLPDGVCIQFPDSGQIEGKAFGLGGCVTLAPSPLDPEEATGEFHWGGIAGTHWWISPKANLAGLLMTQRQDAFWHPFSFEFKQLVYQAVSRTRKARPI